jgi:hypothetical protein
VVELYQQLYEFEQLGMEPGIDLLTLERLSGV